MYISLIVIIIKRNACTSTLYMCGHVTLFHVFCGDSTWQMNMNPLRGKNKAKQSKVYLLMSSETKGPKKRNHKTSKYIIIFRWSLSLSCIPPTISNYSTTPNNYHRITSEKKLVEIPNQLVFLSCTISVKKRQSKTTKCFTCLNL